MATANEYYQSLLREIKEEGQMDRNPRPKYKDGTPAYTRFITLPDSFKSNGKTPLVTLRPTATFLGIKEMLAFYQLQTNKIEDFHKLMLILLIIQLIFTFGIYPLIVLYG